MVLFLIHLIQKFDFIGPTAFGAIDGKVVDGELLQKGQAWIYSSPSHEDQPFFDFRNGFEKVPHKGIPEVMNFNWTLVETHK
jgi:hypothetical protein